METIKLPFSNLVKYSREIRFCAKDEMIDDGGWHIWDSGIEEYDDRILFYYMKC